MAARSFARDALCVLQRETVKLWVKGTGAGAANLTAISSAGGGVASIAETGTGLYTVTLADKYKNLLSCVGSVIDATAPAVWAVTVVTETVASTKTITLAVFKAGALADLTTDEKLMLEITLSNCSFQG